MDSQCGAVKFEELSEGEMWFRIDNENSTTLKKQVEEKPNGVWQGLLRKLFGWNM